MKRLKADKRREQLLDTAAVVFATRGYARSTTAQLAKAAGVTEPIIYRHFESKKELFIALVERTAKHTLDHWRQRLADAKDSTERLRRLLGDNPMTLDETREPYLVLMQAITEVDDKDIRKAVTSHFANLHGFLVKELKRAQEERRVLSRFSAELIAWTLIHLGVGYGVLAGLGVEGQGEDKEGHHVQELIERLLIGPVGDAGR
ncbi:MAG: TetR family transcriptional regulator [Phycisphaerales bacterium]|jgi:AcrR family transcriptional regulator